VKKYTKQRNTLCIKTFIAKYGNKYRNHLSMQYCATFFRYLIIWLNEISHKFTISRSKHCSGSVICGRLTDIAKINSWISIFISLLHSVSSERLTSSQSLQQDVLYKVILIFFTLPPYGS